jgi:hypothetical protein
MSTIRKQFCGICGSEMFIFKDAADARFWVCPLFHGRLRPIPSSNPAPDPLPHQLDLPSMSDEPQSYQ